MTTRLSSRFGKYTKIERVGEGGFGHVYRAFDTELQRWVALKVPHEELLGDPKFVKQFRQEAQIAAQLDHPNIVRIYSIGEYQGTPYIEMEYVEGKTLAALIQAKRRFTPREALNILIPVCEALEYAHRQGIIHQDIKPENILIREKDGRVLVTDFGLARARERSFQSGLSSTGVVVGTFRYMPPEQAEPKLGKIGPWSDVYSLGVVLYQMLTGRLPFAGRSAAQLIYQHVNEPPEPPSNININIDQGVESVVLKALQKRPQERFQSAEEMAAALRAAVEQGKVVPGVYPRRQAIKSRREPSRNWQTAVLGGVILAAFVVLVVVFAWRMFTFGGEKPTEVAMVVAPSSPLSEQAPTPTLVVPTPTPVPPPPLTPTPVPPTATATPTPSATPTPNWDATATAQAHLLATAVSATLTAQPTPTFTPTLESTSTPTPTSPPPPTSIPTPTLSPTPVISLPVPPLVLPVEAKTPVPWPNTPITADNATKLVELAYWSGDKVRRIVFSHDRRMLAISTVNGIYILSSEALEQERHFHKGVSVDALAISPDSSLLASSMCSDLESEKCIRGRITLWQTRDGAMLWNINAHTAHINDLAFSPNSTLLASASDDKSIRIWHLSGRLKQVLTGHTESVTAIGFSHTGDIIVSGSSDKTVRLWRVTDGVLLYTLEGHDFRITDVALSPDDTLIASSSCGEWYEEPVLWWEQHCARGEVRLWRVSDGTLAYVLKGHEETVTSIAFSPDGTLLVSGGWDGTLYLWRVSDGTLLHVIRAHKGWITDIAFAPDGTVLASGSLDGTVRLWGIP